MGELNKSTREALLASLPEACRKECTIARFAITEIATGRILNLDAARRLLATCVDGPEPVGTCGTEKIVCTHEAAGNSTNSHEQVDSIVSALLNASTNQ